MEIKNIIHAAEILHGFVTQRMHAYQAALQSGKISASHQGFKHCAELKSALAPIINGNTSSFLVAAVAKRVVSFYAICSRKEGASRDKQLAKVNKCLSFLKQFSYPKAA
jgi:hypothetical protein